MAMATNPGGADVADRQLASLAARQDALRAAIERRATEVVRAWLIAQGRTWLAVEVTKTRPEPPFDADAELAAAVAQLPRSAFGCGLDVRGSFIVRLADLNAVLSRAHDDATADDQRPRLEMVLVRDPDGGTGVTLFLDGVEFDDFTEFVIDAGAGHCYSDWTESRDGAIAAASPAAAALLAASFDYPPGHQYIEDAPDGWPFENGRSIDDGSC